MFPYIGVHGVATEHTSMWSALTTLLIHLIFVHIENLLLFRSMCHDIFIKRILNVEA